MSRVAAQVFRWLSAGRSTLFLRVALGGLFFLAAYGKFQNLNAFFGSVMNFGLVDANTAYAVSRVLPVIEVAAGVWLISGWKAFSAALFGMGLTGVFTLVLVSAWLRGLDVDCACFGPLPLGASPAAAVVRNVFLLGIFGWLAWRCRCQEERVQVF